MGALVLKGDIFQLAGLSDDHFAVPHSPFFTIMATSEHCSHHLYLLLVAQHHYNYATLWDHDTLQ